MVVLVMFSYQGDNIKEALQLASLLDSWLGHRHCSVSQLHLLLYCKPVHVHFYDFVFCSQC